MASGAGHVGPYIRTLSFTLSRMEPEERKGESRLDAGVHRVSLAVFGEQTGKFGAGVGSPGRRLLPRSRWERVDQTRWGQWRD